MRYNRFLWWIPVLTITLITGWITTILLHSLPIAPNTQQPRLRTVVVATTTIPLRRSIGLSEITTRQVPAAIVPEGAVESLDQVLGQMATNDIYPNELIRVEQIITPDRVTQQVALSVPKGKTVVVIPTNSQLIYNRLVRPGDHIDLFATFAVDVERVLGRTPLQTSVTFLQNLEVHAVILPRETVPTAEAAEAVAAETTVDGTAAMPSSDAQTQKVGGEFRTHDRQGQALLLAVEPQDSIALHHLLDTGGQLDIALRPEANSVRQPTVAVDQYYLAERYNIKMVQGAVAVVGFVGSPIYPPDVPLAYPPAE
ncbi:MAG: RcpC/CpaB family pilus assembly protein [Caldilineaceae bacterium]